MKTRHLHRLSFCLLVWLASGQIQAEQGVIYRVDVIVFSHLDGASDQRRGRQISDFGERLDTETHARAAAWTARDDGEEISVEERTRLEALATMDQLIAMDSPEQRHDGRFRGGPDFPTPWLGLDDMSAEMIGAWQRLETSQRHQALVWRSWYQRLGQNDASRWIRLRGGRLLGLDWLEQEAVDPGYLEDHDPGPYPFLLPRTRHQLDGAIRLRQRQFMHADLDLVWQVPVAATPSPLLTDWYQPAGFSVHPLEQSRSIRPGRIEYFDSSWLGALIHIQAVDSTPSGPDGDQP